MDKHHGPIFLGHASFLRYLPKARYTTFSTALSLSNMVPYTKANLAKKLCLSPTHRTHKPAGAILIGFNYIDQ